MIFTGAIVSGGKGTAAAKFEALSAAGAYSLTSGRMLNDVNECLPSCALVLIAFKNY